MRLEAISRALLLRRLRFGALNLSAVLLLIGLVFVPLASHVAAECEEISESTGQLARLQALVGARGLARDEAAQADGAFFSVQEERLASADLQAMLKALSQDGGLQLLGLRSITPRRAIVPRAVAVGLELEGPLASLRDTLQKIEAARPMLVVTGLVLRPASAGDNASLRAELTIQGALPPLPPRTAVLEQGQ